MPAVGLYVTCLVDLHRANVGFAAIYVLEQAACTVSVPGAQVCCGQPAYSRSDDELVTGPSRTADMEQTLEIRALGPWRMHVRLVAGQPE